MKIVYKSFEQKHLLPYDGSTIEFLAKNLRITPNQVFDVLGVISITSDEFIVYLINERVKNRLRKLGN
ncbi:hypothetical protein SAMN06265348_12417 [Pedobacter westerhofensis]|uniref:Uncharacterized protein n=1 Tax=Pedobacter westerhofensis TaxID=425512 RepID=A0A521FU51_9SPHI|nr:hypothetical protein SAMN06265348_12417 [Pedobacter westerhofensis]